MRNPFGDRLFYKALTTWGSVVLSPSANQWFAFPATQFNSMPDLAARFGSLPGLLALSNVFYQYRIRGVKLTMTAWPSIDAFPVPICMFIQGASRNEFSDASMVNGPEQRWFKYRTVRNAANGATPSSVSMYLNVNKIFGPDQIVKNDQAFIGSVPTAGSPPNAWNAPTSAGPWVRAGFFTLDGLNTQAGAVRVTVKFSLIIYLEMFGKRVITS